MPTTMRWVGLALLGVMIAVGVSIAASGLVSQQIGLASEPMTAGDALVPQAAVEARHHRRRGGETPSKAPTPHTPPPATTTVPETTESPPPATAPPSTVPPAKPPTAPSPSGGERDHSGSGGGADD